MAWLNTEQKFKLIRFYWETKSIITTQRRFQKFYRTNAPTRKTILRLCQKFIKKGRVENQNKGQSGRKRSKRTPEIIEKVRQKITADPRKSTRRLAQEVRVSQTTLENILKKDLKLHPYKIMEAQEISDRDKEDRVMFAR